MRQILKCAWVFQTTSSVHHSLHPFYGYKMWLHRSTSHSLQINIGMQFSRHMWYPYVVSDVVPSCCACQCFIWGLAWGFTFLAICHYVVINFNRLLQNYNFLWKLTLQNQTFKEILYYENFEPYSIMYIYHIPVIFCHMHSKYSVAVYIIMRQFYHTTY